MQLYSKMIKNVHDIKEGREDIEWSNYWIDNADKETEQRILLIGDSTMRMVRSTFAKMAKIPVDMWGGSYGLHDIIFAKQMDILFCSNVYKYDAIFVQLGHHSRINQQGVSYTDEDYLRFEEDLEIFVDYLSQFCKNIILCSVFYSVVPSKNLNIIHNDILKKALCLVIKKIKQKPEKLDEEANKVKIKKNIIIARVAKNKNIKFIDINGIMMEYSKKRNTRCYHVDHIHFEEKAKKIIVNQYIKAI